MCNGIELSHWSALSQCLKVRNNCSFDMRIEYVNCYEPCFTDLRKKFYGHCYYALTQLY